MNVGQLIERLRELDPNMMVVRAGYEGGLTEIGFVNTIEALLNVNEEWYYGEHEEAEEYAVGKYPNAQRAKVVELA